MRLSIKTSAEMQAEATAAGRENHIISCLLGGSRRDVAIGALKAAVFTGVVPPAPIIPVHELPQAAGDLFAGIKKFAGNGVPIPPCGLEGRATPGTVSSEIRRQRADLPPGEFRGCAEKSS
jgi:hypothetical protein